MLDQVRAALAVIANFAFVVLPPGATAQTARHAGSASPASVDAPRQWVATYGTLADEQVFDIATIDARGFLMLAATGNTSTRDAWIVRLDRRGNVLSENTLGGSGRDELRSLAATPDGGFLAAGMTNSGGLSSDGWIVKLDALGAVEWQRTYDTDFADEEFSSIAASPDGAYVGGHTSFETAEAWVLEIDADGEILWAREFDGNATPDQVSSLAATDAGVAIAVTTRNTVLGGLPFGLVRPWLIALDGDGNALWQRIYDVSGRERWTHLVALGNSGFVATGSVSGGDAWTVRLDDDGDVLWDKRLGDHFGNQGVDLGRRVLPTKDGGFVIAGETATAGLGTQAAWAFKLAPGGEVVWERVFGGTTFDLAAAIAPAGPGYVIAGTSRSFGAGLNDAWGLRLSAKGKLHKTCGLRQLSLPSVSSGPVTVGVPTFGGFSNIAGSFTSTLLAGDLGVVASYVCVPP